MKTYQKPEVEVIDLVMQEETTTSVGGSMGVEDNTHFD